MITIINQLNIFIMKKVILNICDAIISIWFAQHGHGQHQHGGPEQQTRLRHAANYSIVTETGNNNSATIQQTGDKHVSEVTQDGLNYGFGAIKTEAFVTQSGENQK
jgi:hypothetical protein